MFQTAWLPVALFAGLGAFPVLAFTVAHAPTPPPAVGEAAPDFELKDLDGKPVKLSAETGKGPVVLVVLRGFPGYQCPLCTRQVGELAGKAKEFAAAGARVLLVYPGPADGLTAHAKEFRAGKPLPDGFTLLTDPDYTFTTRYHLRWDAPNETAYPSTFVVAKGGTVRYAVVSKTHGGRAKTADVLTAVAAAR